jgi:hypothetical protein
MEFLYVYSVTFPSVVMHTTTSHGEGFLNNSYRLKIRERFKIKSEILIYFLRYSSGVSLSVFYKPLSGNGSESGVHYFSFWRKFSKITLRILLCNKAVRM